MAYTTIDDPSEYFQTVIWTGNGASDTRTISFDGNSDMQPDWVWHKQRNEAYGNHVFDSSRGFGANKELVTRGNFVEGDTSNFNTGAYGYVNAATSDGFVVKKGTDSSNGNRYINESSDTHVAWCWKANGGTTTTNDASATSVGTIDSVYQANTTAGFSIVTYTGTGSAGTIAHGLGATPKTYWIKRRSSGTADWYVYHSSIGATKNLRLNKTDASNTDSNIFNDTEPTSSVFSLGSSFSNTSSKDYLAYCFAEKQGYSKFGSYTGNGNADGTFVYTGLKPAWVLIKRTDSTGNWFVYDTARDTFNVADAKLEANDTDAEVNPSSIILDILSNGFKPRSNNSQMNASGGTYIYMAFAEHPFVSSKGAPVTAR